MTYPKQHVVPHMKGWAVRPESGEMASEVFPTKKQAMLRAREIADRNDTKVVEHGRDGKFRDVRTPRDREKTGPNQHVVPTEKGWKVEPAKGKRASKIFKTKELAVKRGREIAENYGSTLFVHKNNGTFQRVSEH